MRQHRRVETFALIQPPRTSPHKHERRENSYLGHASDAIFLIGAKQDDVVLTQRLAFIELAATLGDKKFIGAAAMRSTRRRFS